MILITAMVQSCTPGHDTFPEIQGHRGCRGLMPENTIAGFIHALDLGVNTLELDVVITGDSQVVVSHEPFFNHLISTAPGGREITEADEKQYNIYTMSMDEVRSFDVGLKPHPKYPLQTKMPATKPTLEEAIFAVENHISKNGLKPVRYNIEIKHIKDQEYKYFPPCDVSANLVFKAITKAGIKDKVIIQSFDAECLEFVHRLDKTLPIALLVENRDGPANNLARLSFKPEAYSPHYSLVDTDLIKHCRREKIKLIPWTVNEVKDIEAILRMEVDGLITDYPDRAIEIRTSLFGHR